MDDVVKAVLDGIWNAIPNHDNDAVRNAVASWLRVRGCYVCDDNRELRELALLETDLVEPPDEE